MGDKIESRRRLRDAYLYEEFMKDWNKNGSL